MVGTFCTNSSGVVMFSSFLSFAIALGKGTFAGNPALNNATVQAQQRL